MTSERRWLDDHAPQEARLALESAELDEPTAAQLESLRARVAPLFDVPPPSSPSSSSPPAAPPVSALGPLAGKILVGITLLAVGGGVGLWFGKRDETPPVAPVTVALPLPIVAPPARREKAEAEAPPPTPPNVAPRKPAIAKPAAPTPSEDEELAQLQAAMAAPGAAQSLALLEQHATRFPQSNLTQEREVLTVKALMKLDRVDEARAKAADFKQRWPTSPHLLRVQVLVGK